MIRIQKKQSFNLDFLSLAASLTYLAIPFFLPRPLSVKSTLIIISTYLLTALIIYLHVVFYAKKKNLLSFKRQDLQEKINLFGSEEKSELDKIEAIQDKISRYKNLKNLTEEFNKNLSLQTAAETLLRWVFELVAQKKSTAILYLINKRRQKLEIVLTQKPESDESVVIKAKEGDLFDKWVLRHSTDLIVEDSSKDFRFDLSKVQTEERREIGSLISAPVLSADNFLGIIRVDNPVAEALSVYDLRLLRNIADLGAVAIENAIIYQHTQELAIRDDLTGLYRRNYLIERLNEELLREKSLKKRLSFLMLDIDNFKLYNDKFGHIAGDIVLKTIAERLKEDFTSQFSIAARMGGEEFAVMLIGAGKKEAVSIAEDFRKKIFNHKFILRRQETTVTVSIGVSSLSDKIKTGQQLIEDSDKALYRAKESGKNKVCFF